MAIDFSNIHNFALETLGCKVNRVESDSLKALITQSGREIVQPEDTECVIVNTCTVTSEADKKARKVIRSLMKRAPKAHVIVTGCAAAIHPNMFAALGDQVQVIDRTELFIQLKDALNGLDSAPLLRVGEGFRTRVGIKVQDGCDNACTYCIVHVARGPARSMSFESILNEVRGYLDNKVKEIVLTGIDLGSYQSNNVNITQLLAELVRMAHESCPEGEIPTRFRASSLEPLSITDEFIELLASNEGSICRHLHLPLQSGSTKVLKEMDRPYSAEDYLALVEKLYERIPTLSLSTDIICGFPGETDSDFEETLYLARQARFSKIHVFPYSKREGTPAAAREDQVAPEIITVRASQLRVLASELRQADRKSRAGSTELVLCEGSTGLSESYHEIELAPGIEQGALLPVVLD